MKSLWMPIVRWRQVTEEGISGGPVMPADYNGSAASIDKLRTNISKAGIVGSLVANDLRSTMIVTPLLELNPQTGKPLNYGEFSDALEQKIRSFEKRQGRRPHRGLRQDRRRPHRRPVQSDAVLRRVGGGGGGVRVISSPLPAKHGAAGERRRGRCRVAARLMHLLGYQLDPYSILVPFLILAIGLSHGAQKMNGILQDVGRGTHKYVAARYTFRRLFMAGLTALLTKHRRLRRSDHHRHPGDP